MRTEKGFAEGCEIHYGMDFDTYCRLPGINASALKGDGRHSPKHLKAYREGRIASTDSDDKMFGRAAHCMILEPEHFEERFPIAGQCAAVITTANSPNFNKQCTSQGTRRNPVGSWFCGTHGKTLPEATDYLTADTAKRLLRLREELKQSTANEFLARPGYCEAVITWRQLGFDLKTRLDKLSVDEFRAIVVDFKKCQVGKANYEQAQKACKDYRYDIQSWFHIAGVKAAFGLHEKQIDAHFLFIEDNEPFDTYLLKVDSWDQYGECLGIDLEIATNDVIVQLQRFKRCEAAGKFDGCQPVIDPAKCGILPQQFVKEKRRT